MRILSGHKLGQSDDEMEQHRTLRRNEDNKMKGLPLKGGEKTQNKDEEGRKKNEMKERERQRIWDLAWGNQTRIQILGDSKSDCALDEREIEEQQSKILDDGARDAEHDRQD